MIRRITGPAALGKDQLDTAAVCKQCDHAPRWYSPESLERHSTRCANGGQRHYMHVGLVALIVIILLADSWHPPQELYCAGKEGLRPGNRTRPCGDVVILDFFGLGSSQLAIYVVLLFCTVYHNVILAQACFIPGYADKMMVDRKFYNDKTSTHLVTYLGTT